jgi:hypothetical protein
MGAADARRLTAALAAFRLAVTKDREQAKVRSRSLRAKWSAALRAREAGASGLELARIADTQGKEIREWCGKAEALRNSKDKG